MRKVFLGVVLLVVLAGSTAFVIFRLTRRPPTPFGWRAHVTSVAGNGSPTFRDAAQGLQAAFADPFGIAIDGEGVVYISDAGESNRIRKLTPNGLITTLAGGVEGHADGAGSQASLNTPSGLALDQHGNLFVADTGNNRIRKITPQGSVSTIAGEGTAGFVDGPASKARFDGPIGIAIDKHDVIYVADTYNDRIRKITPAGQVSTLAGAGRPGYADSEASVALFDTPSGLVVTAAGEVIVADTGNNRLRKITPDGQVTTLSVVFSPDVTPTDLRKPLGLALSHDGFIYVSELDRSRVVQIAPDGSARLIAGGSPGFANGADDARFNQPAGIAIDRRGDLYLADGGNYVVRKLSQSSDENARAASLGGSAAVISERSEDSNLPRLSAETLGEHSLLWPLDPQQRPHEVVATIGEVRGSFDSNDSRDHLHSGLDVFGAYGDFVRAVRSEKITSPLPNWGLGDLSEGLRVGLISYIHIHVGRDKDGNVFPDQRFVKLTGDDDNLARIRVRRGSRFRPGDALGTVNRMYHVHMNVGPPGAEMNPLSLSPVGFSDRMAPVIEADGIQLFDASGARLAEKLAGRLLVRGQVQIVVDAFDRTDMSRKSRRLGLYRLGYQVIRPDGTQAPGFEQPRINLVFNRLPPGRDATKLAYAEQSGITVYGSTVTRFLYNVTNIVRDGEATSGIWDTSELPKGDYTLRIIAGDFSGNEAQENRDLLITID